MKTATSRATRVIYTSLTLYENNRVKYYLTLKFGGGWMLNTGDRKFLWQFQQSGTDKISAKTLTEEACGAKVVMHPCQ